MHFMKTLVIPGFLVGNLAVQPAFGCRLMAEIEPRTLRQSPVVEQEKDSFVYQLFSTDTNSLQKESIPHQITALNPNNITYDGLYGVGQHGQPDGSGFAAYSALRQPAIVWKSIKPAYADPDYSRAILGILPADLVLGHIRFQSVGGISLDNIHPFAYENWSFIHNGTINGALSPVIQNKINLYRIVLGGGPKGNTDSERVFYYILSRLYETTGTTDSGKIPLSKLQSVFANALSELLSQSKPAYKPLTGTVMGIKGNLQFEPSCNFVLSDGNRLLAFKKGFDLFLGEKALSNGQKIYVISSEKTSDQSIQWLAVPEEHVVIISRDQQGNPTPVIEPLSRLVNIQAGQSNPFLFST